MVWGDNLTRGRGRGNGSTAASERQGGRRPELAASGVEAEAGATGAAGATLTGGWSFLSKDTFPM